MKKTIMVHIDGMPTHSFDELGPRTVLQVANIPFLDELARHGELGRFAFPEESRVFAGELAFLSLLGYDTQKWYVGPGVFESMNLEVMLDRNDVAFLCDFVTLRAKDDWGDGKKLGSALIMDDVSGGGLETEEARELLDAINEQLVSENIQFYMGHQARHLMVWAGGNAKIGCRDPRGALGQSIEGFLATGDGAEILRELMEASRMILRHHPVNQERVNAGLKPANCLWPWGQSKQAELPTLQERWPIRGAVVSQDGPYRGVAMAAGLHVVKIEDSVANESDRLEKMVDIAAKILEKHDLACLHVPFSNQMLQQEQPVSASTFVENLEQVDEHLIGPLQKLCDETNETRLFVVATSCTNKVEEGRHPYSRYVLYEGPKADGHQSTVAFHDEEVSDHPLQHAANFFERFFGKK